uniref:Uncharacterized protein n=1 Tax=Sphingomonas sp. JE1 TaxID=1628059 RepID=A0A0D5A0C9_9SPHN|nr:MULTISPECIES: hypothetical protein [unclassified Sphingomonas]AJW29611.1 hypothetical protein pJE1_189 [Sphingomonas sp. JE1]
MELELILERELTSHRPVAGTITDVQVHQREDDGKWYINVRVSWRGSTAYHVALYDKKRIRLYSKVSSAIRHIVNAYGYSALIGINPSPHWNDPSRF